MHVNPKIYLWWIFVVQQFVNKFAYICTVEKRFEQYKGIHPGIVIDRELKRRGIKQRPFALSLPEHPQTFNTITKGKRSLTTALALKIEHALQIEEGTLVFLQAYYDIGKEKSLMQLHTPDISVFRKAIFWDTNFQQLDWSRQYRAIIQRVYERGNDAEKNEIRRFYGVSKVALALKAKATKPMMLHPNKQ